MFKDAEQTFVQTLALIVLEDDFTYGSPYQKGWLEGYARAYTQLTGKSIHVLVREANEAIEHSGKALVI